ncbi:MAG: hypothetical protein ABI140_08625, partial [Jatrophihabitantaceae bacterium]
TAPAGASTSAGASGQSSQPSTISASTSPASTSPAAAACDRGPWADRVQGAPVGFTGGSRGGDYLWHDSTGFHLRVTHKSDDRQVYTGVLTASAPMRIDPVRLEAGDVARLSADHRSLIFAFANHGHIDGVNFHTDCALSLTVSHLNVGRSALTPDRVYLGITRAHPARIPFTVHRELS